MKRKFLSMLLAMMLIVNLALPRVQIVSAETTTTLTIEDKSFYNQLKTGFEPKTAVKSSDDTNKTITLAMEEVERIKLPNLSSSMKMAGENKTILEKLLSECKNLTMLQLRNADISNVDFSSLNNRQSLRILCLVSGKLKKAPDLTLPGLTDLYLSGNDFSAPDSCENITAEKLPSLRNLYMDGCATSAPLDLDVIKQLNMGKLSTLSLCNNHLTDDTVAALLDMNSSLSGLTTLNLGAYVHWGPGQINMSRAGSSNSIKNIAQAAKLPVSFPKLTALELTGLNITSMREFANVREDIEIDFSKNYITDFSEIETHKKFVVQYQTIVCSEQLARGWGNEIPELLKRVMDKSDELYARGTSKYYNCKLSDDGTKLIVAADAASNKRPVVQLDISIYNKLGGSEIQFPALKELDDPVVPNNLTATEGDTLAQVNLNAESENDNGFFTWEDTTQDVGTPGVHTFLADYTLEDEGQQYVKYGIEVPVTVKKSAAKPSPTPTPDPSPTPTLSPSPAPTLPPSPTPGLSSSPTPEATKQPAMTPTPKPDESKMTGNQIEKRKDLSLLLATGKQKGSNGIKLTWRKKNGCSGYEVYWSYCDGKQNFKKLKTVRSNGKRQCIHKKLKKNRAYKYYIATYTIKDGRKNYQSKSPVIHVAMKREKHTNAKRIKVNKAKVVLKVNKTFQIKAKAVLENRKKELLNHDRKFRYYVDNRDVVSVSKNGKIKAKKKGTCSVFVTANNGVAKQIKVTVQ